MISLEQIRAIFDEGNAILRNWAWAWDCPPCFRAVETAKTSSVALSDIWVLAHIW
jgi:hypothetical protein